MNRIQKISTYLLLILNGLLIITLLFTIAQWSFISPKTSRVLDAGNFFGLFERGIKIPGGYIDLGHISWTPLLQLSAFGADMLGLAPFLISLFMLKAIFKNYQKGEVFSVANAIFYRRLGALFLFDGLFIKSLSQTLMTLLATFNNAPGHRCLSISFSTPNFVSLFYGVLVIIVSMVMLEASKIHEEQKFTV